ncbi:hypothetical protein Oweho_0786 [Owenweeksia hongkongensis DSM 17368]|uniref:GRAM domain-containing protein n=1 Tax=Owenweeksia hongkongensis (strain DSM 17368 / CIP 108786 / JCM 12287 / NRRL B-23963 / UST20020801) TaxID=926562 RepID=G8R249_OWEHD|nr:hypothetical protein [Owenweeksia hongkongensis]AEV31799.1 hypothetical protein Oweho_0786 [Owenweeksia hongkongensis DSM 17368]
MPSTLKSQTPLSAVLYWCLVVTAITIGSFFISWEVAFGTAGFLAPTVNASRNYRTKYVFEEDHLLIHAPFEKVQIAFSNIRSAHLVKANLAQKLIGIPSEIVSLKYNKFDERFLLNGSKEMLEKIQSNLSEAA